MQTGSPPHLTQRLFARIYPMPGPSPTTSSISPYVHISCWHRSRRWQVPHDGHGRHQNPGHGDSVSECCELSQESRTAVEMRSRNFPNTAERGHDELVVGHQSVVVIVSKLCIICFLQHNTATIGSYRNSRPHNLAFSLCQMSVYFQLTGRHCQCSFEKEIGSLCVRTP